MLGNNKQVTVNTELIADFDRALNTVVMIMIQCSGTRIDQQMIRPFTQRRLTGKREGAELIRRRVEHIKHTVSHLEVGCSR
ncbi:MAG: hypothetical protein CL861_07495 [Cyanobium sp. MED843]|nr:hypothetical protein [Cyanobium sp. MED843]OUW27571.1 MAG: hypothetical protein CBD37_06985 [Cyanobacteria bacterium TMED177]